MNSNSTVALVSCSVTKAESPRKARDLYCSPWFKKARAYVEQRGLQWYILSAAHNLLLPDDIIAPYNKTLIGMTQLNKAEWAQTTARQLIHLHPEPTVFEILAGTVYRQYLVPELVRRGHSTLVPMEGMGIGRQLQWLTQHEPKIKSNTCANTPF